MRFDKFIPVLSERYSVDCIEVCIRDGCGSRCFADGGAVVATRRDEQHGTSVLRVCDLDRTGCQYD